MDEAIESESKSTIVTIWLMSSLTIYSWMIIKTLTKAILCQKKKGDEDASPRSKKVRTRRRISKRRLKKKIMKSLMRMTNK